MVLPSLRQTAWAPCWPLTVAPLCAGGALLALLAGRALACVVFAALDALGAAACWAIAGPTIMHAMANTVMAFMATCWALGLPVRCEAYWYDSVKVADADTEPAVSVPVR